MSYTRQADETARGFALRVAAGIGTDDPPSLPEMREAAAILEPCCHLSEQMLTAALQLARELVVDSVARCLP